MLYGGSSKAALPLPGLTLWRRATSGVLARCVVGTGMVLAWETVTDMTLWLTWRRTVGVYLSHPERRGGGYWRGTGLAPAVGPWEGGADHLLRCNFIKL